MSVFIVSANTTFRTPYIELSSTTCFSHVVDDNWIYGILNVVFEWTINTNNIMACKIDHILTNNKSSLHNTKCLYLLILYYKGNTVNQSGHVKCFSLLRQWIMIMPLIPLPLSAVHPIGKSLWELWKSQKSGEEESGVS